MKVMHSLTRHLRDDSGFSLSEMLVVSVLVSVIITAAYFVLNTVSGLSDTVEARAVAAEESRLFLDTITRELRQAEEPVEGNGVVLTAQDRQITFYTDLDHNGIPERVRYYVNAGALYRVQATATNVVAPYTYGAESAPRRVITQIKGDWTGKIFTYYKQAQPPTLIASGAVADISAIQIEVFNGATFGVKTAYVDQKTWVKVRSVHNTID